MKMFLFRSLQPIAALITVLGFVYSSVSLLPDIHFNLREYSINFFIIVFIYLFVEFCFAIIFAKIINFFNIGFREELFGYQLPGSVVFSFLIMICLISAWQTVSVALLFFQTGDGYYRYLIFPFFYSLIVYWMTVYDHLKYQDSGFSIDPIFDDYLGDIWSPTLLYFASYLFVVFNY
ncbi:hypothetical protein BKI51_14630 [Alphaproteobacteria bacterium AO1-B]|nr:hypothetical protein BKI51_14630 [Alphaproteobacteria bacterium AO1-B]